MNMKTHGCPEGAVSRVAWLFLVDLLVLSDINDTKNTFLHCLSNRVREILFVDPIKFWYSREIFRLRP